MGNTPASKMRCFCVLFVVHAAQVLTRTITLALLFATQPWWAAVYLGGDFLVLVAYKAARRDLVYWVPSFGLPISLLGRFICKVFTDSTACVQFRHPFELGGLYYTLNAVLGQEIPIRQAPWPCDRPCDIRGSIGATVQVAAFGSVALYVAYYVGEARLEASTLYIVVGALAAVWAVSLGVLLLTMKRKYMKTFFSTDTGGEFVMNHFLDNAGDDEIQAEIFCNNQEQWRPIRPQVEAWLRARFKIWKREKPAWFTEALRRSIPTDMLPPRDARGSSVHDASLAQRLSLSLGVHLSKVTLSQVTPLGTPEADSETRADSESSDSEAETQPLPTAGTEAKSAS
jgi:hypothetical protein